MSAPFLWIFFPALLGAILLVVRNQRLITLLAGITSALLAIVALLLPIDEVLTLQRVSFTLMPSFQVLGRSLVLENADRAWLCMLYGAAALWFFASSSAGITRRMVPIGLVITGLLVAALAVEPFLYAALLLETAVLLSIPLLSPPDRRPGRGTLRFLIYQTIAMAFILFSGWLLSGIEANPGDVVLVTRSLSLLGLGFALLLAVFPFYTWIPLLAEEAHPYIAGFMIWSFPTVTLFFGLGFLEKYTWLREAGELPVILTSVGVVMILTAGLFAFFERHLGRLMGYAVIMETGFSLLALGVGGKSGLDAFLLFCMPRAVSLWLWALGLSRLQEHAASLKQDDLKGAARIWSFSSLGMILAGLSLAGVPLLASFPVRQALWDKLAGQSLTGVALVFAGSLGFTISIMRVLASLVSAPDNATWGTRESWFQRGFLVLGGFLLLLTGIIPSWLAAYWAYLPPLFEHLGR